jgi:hypothetical protein
MDVGSDSSTSRRNANQRESQEEAMSDQFFVAFKQLKCLEETDDGGSPSDEPYAIIFAADLQGPIPRANAFRTHVFGGTQQGDVRKQQVRFWGLDKHAQPITDPDRVLFLVMLMENDSSSPDLVLNSARGMMFANLVALVSAGVPRAALVKALKSTMRSAADLGAAPGEPYPDDQVGGAQELQIKQADLHAAQNGPLSKSLTFRYGDGSAGRYRLDFDISSTKHT